MNDVAPCREFIEAFIVWVVYSPPHINIKDGGGMARHVRRRTGADIMVRSDKKLQFQ